MNTQLKGIWIDKWVLDLDIKPVEMILLAEINNLAQDEQGCTANNAHFAKRLKCNNSYISQMITRFVEAGLLYREIKYYPGSKQIESRHLYVTPPVTRVNTPVTIVQREKEEELSIESSITCEKQEKPYSHKWDDVYSFDQFWNDYGLKKRKKAAWKYWKRLTRKDVAAIKEFLPAYLSESDPKYRQYPRTFLSERTWEDYQDQKTEKQDTAQLSREHQEKYSLYLKWIEQNHPAIIQAVKYFSADQFRQYRELEVHIDDSMKFNFLKIAHRRWEMDQGREAFDIFLQKVDEYKKLLV